MQYVTLEDTVYLWFGANDTAGSGSDGAAAIFDVREGGALASAAPTLSGSASLLSHANYPNGAYEVAIPATAANGFSANKSYAVFCTLLVDSQNPTGFVGAFRTTPIPTAAQVRAEMEGAGTKLTLVKTKTDQMNFTDSNKLQSDVKAVNGVPVTGTGTSGDEWGP